MKKLMIAAAIVCAAVVSQAASASWQVHEMYDWNDINKDVPSYDVMGANYATYFVVATAEFGVDEMKEALEKGDFSWMTTQKVGTPTAPMAAGAASGVMDGFGNSETINAFAVVFNNADYKLADYAYVTDIGTGATGSEGQAATISIDATDSYDPSGWTAVPEPTSGLLLLLGVAGLALKRKRA